MKRLLACLAACLLLPLFSSCDIDVSIDVDAQAILYYPDGRSLTTEVATYGPYYHRNLTNYDLRKIFNDLILHTDKNFQNADLILHYWDNITNEDLGEDGYGVSYNNRTEEFDFVHLAVYVR
jgi:hypothetical protein